MRSAADDCTTPEYNSKHQKATHRTAAPTITAAAHNEATTGAANESRTAPGGQHT